MYFDTLKVSGMEQAAEQVSARGGLGNAEHVIWDYGKEITVTLQDALFSPVSYNLLWGGQLGLKDIKIKGFFDPFIYEQDQYGNSIYFKKKLISKEKYDEILSNAAAATEKLKDETLPWEHQQFYKEQVALAKRAVSFICPCDGNIKYAVYESTTGHFQYSEWSKNTPEHENVNRMTGHFIGEPLSRESKKIIQTNGKDINIYTVKYFNKIIEKEMEMAELKVNAFSDFEFHNYQIEEFDNYMITKDEAEYQDKSVKNIKHSVLEYDWNSCIAKMSCLGKEKQIALHNDLNLCYQSFYHNTNKRILFRTFRGYESVIDFYSIVRKEITTQFGERRLIEIPVLLGAFYIIEDFNIPTDSEEYVPLTPNSSIQDIKLIEVMDKYEADRPFAIDVDQNIKSYNCSQMPKYKNADITVFYNPLTMSPYEANEHSFERANGQILEGNLYVFKPNEQYLKYRRVPAPAHQSLGKRIVVTAEKYPGIFKLVGETHIRERDTAKDLNCQIEIPLCKLASDTSISLEAEGEPAVQDMSLKVLRPEDGEMVRLSFYNKDILCTSTERKETYSLYDILEEVKYIVDIPNHTTILLAPKTNEIYCVSKDCRIGTYEQDNQSSTYLRLPSKAEIPAVGGRVEDFDIDSYIKNHFNIVLIAEIDENGIIVDYITKERVNTFEAIQGE